MHTETPNRKAFEGLADAIMKIDSYRSSKNRSLLELARRDLTTALTEDPDFLPGHFYSAIVDDLLGRPKDAVLGFQRILSEVPSNDSELRQEIRYNLAVAHYHRYSLKHLDKAQAEFEGLLRDTQDKRLRCLIECGLAQTFAMAEIPSDPDSVNDAELTRIKSKFEASRRMQIDAKKHADLLPKRERDLVLGTALNASGMSLMYYSDFFGPPQEKSAMLDLALEALREADRHIPSDWANWCDLGSAHMRLGLWRNSSTDFQEARNCLLRVVTTLRPNYGFALYEIGRAYRIEGKFDEALEYFEKSRAVHKDYREVGDSRLDRESYLASRQDRKYP